jgi:hypothetical protein
MPKFKALSLAEAWPDEWKYLIQDREQIAIGVDPATTTKKLSNPTSIVVTGKIGNDYFVRAAIRFKTDDPAVTRAMLSRALDLPPGRRVRRIVVLATSERFFATDLRSHFAGKAPVELVIESEKVSYMGEEMTYKLYLGNLVVNMFNDAHLFVPNAVWLRNDLRQPEGATFMADPDENGNHADAFCALGAALHGLTGAGGPVQATAVPLSKIGSPLRLRRNLKNPYAERFVRPLYGTIATR